MDANEFPSTADIFIEAQSGQASCCRAIARLYWIALMELNLVPKDQGKLIGEVHKGLVVKAIKEFG